jgi:PDZ domain
MNPNSEASVMARTLTSQGPQPPVAIDWRCGFLFLGESRSDRLLANGHGACTALVVRPLPQLIAANQKSTAGRRAARRDAMTRSVKLGLLLSAAALLAVFPRGTVLGQTAGTSAHSLPESFRTGNTVSGAQSPIGLSVTDSNGQLIVTGATTNGPFGGLGLRVGDQITGVNGQPVATLGDLLSRLMAAGNTDGQVAVASLDISRNGRPQTINVPNASLG